MRGGVSFDLQQGLEGVSDVTSNPFLSCQMDHKGCFSVLLALKQNSTPNSLKTYSEDKFVQLSLQDICS